MSFGSYQEALCFLFQAIDYEKLTKYKYSLPDFDLARVEHLLSQVGSPHHGLRAIHVAGTKGKGSTSTMIAHFLHRAGFKTGLFTSPHLVHLEERIRIDGEMIPQEAVSQLLGGLRPYIEKERQENPLLAPTFFEIITTLAFMYFREKGVNWAVLEVGMGGRLDATNVIRPRVSVITPIGFDHTDKLGQTLREIALEKAGIIKEGIPVVSSTQPQEALVAIEEGCRQKGACLRLVGRDIEVLREERIPLYGRRCDIRTWRRDYRDLRLPLLGGHQVSNLATALGVMDVLSEDAGLNWSEGLAERTLPDLRCPARIEIISQDPLIILDTAHNTSSMHALGETLKAELGFERLILLMGLSRDKDIRGILKEVVPLASEVVLTSINSPRSAEPDFLAQRLREDLGREGIVAKEALEALRIARRLARPGDCICITGSFYLAGRIKEILEREALSDAPQ